MVDVTLSTELKNKKILPHEISKYINLNLSQAKRIDSQISTWTHRFGKFHLNKQPRNFLKNSSISFYNFYNYLLVRKQLI